MTAMHRTAFILLLMLAVELPGFGWAHPGAHVSIEHFTRQIEQQPLEQRHYVNRGIAYSNDGQYSAALADFQQAEKLGDPVLVSFDLGVLHYRMGKLAPARMYFDTFLGRFPDHAGCLEYRARLARDAGDFETAVADFNRVFDLRERPNPGDYITTAEMLRSMGPGGVVDALAVLDRGNAQIGMTPQLQRYAIELELVRERPDLALARLRALGPIVRESPEWKVEMADLLLRTGQPDQAVEMLEDASAQLESLRRTPARTATLEEANRLLRQIRVDSQQPARE